MFIPMLNIHKVMDKLNANIEQYRRYYVHSCWKRNIVLGLPNYHILSWKSIQQLIWVLVKGLLYLCIELKQEFQLILLLVPLAIFLHSILLTRLLSWLNKLIKICLSFRYFNPIDLIFSFLMVYILSQSDKYWESYDFLNL